MTSHSVFNKAVRVLKSDNASGRIWAAINKSPLRYLVRHSFDISHPRIRRSRRVEIQALNEHESKAVSQLRTKGFVELGSEILDPQALAALLELGDQKLRKIEELKKQQLVQTKTNVWTRLSDDDWASKSLPANHPLVRFSLQESVLRVIAKYLNEAPVLRYTLLTHSSPMQGEPQASQLWHQDHDDVRMAKLFVYLTDVASDEDGPFTFVDAQESTRVANSFITRHLGDQELFRSVAPQKVMKLVRPRASCFIVDTSRCYHMGSRVADGHSRLMYTALFTASPSIYPGMSKGPVIVSEAPLSRLQQLAVRENVGEF